jgi:predicted Zn-dependent protease
VRAHLAAAARASQSAFTEIRYEQRQGTDILQRGSEMVYATSPRSAGGVVRCYNPGRGWGVATFRTLDDLGGALRNAGEASLALRVAEAGPLPPMPARELDLECPAGRDPSGISLQDKIALAAMVGRTARGPDRRVVSTRARYQDSLVETIVVTSEGLSLREVRPELSLSALAVAEESGTTERAVGSIASAGHWTELEQWSRSASLIGERAVLQLHASPVRAGR